MEKLAKHPHTNQRLSDVMSKKEDVEDLSSFKQRLCDLLSAAPYGHSQNNFAGCEDLDDSPNPGLYLEGVGPIGLPVSKYDAGRLVSISKRARCGKRDKTLLDLSCRKSWQINASQIEFRNPAWSIYLHEKLLPRVSDKLGFGPNRLVADFSCMLISGEGDYFKAHQYAETDASTVGSLDIILPSPFTGGQVTVSCGSNQMILDTSANSQFGTSFLCMYAGLFLKIHPITSGYRLVLSYQLKSKFPPDSNSHKSNSMLTISPHMSNIFHKWVTRLEAGKEVPKILAHVLTHRYSEASLNSWNLKGDDRVKVASLRQLAENFGNSVSTQEDALHDYQFKHAVDMDGASFDASFLHLNKEQTIPLFDIAMWDYFEGKFKEHIFNEGCDCKHFFYRAVVLMWPKSQSLALSVEKGGEVFAAYKLREMITCLKTVMHSGDTNQVATKRLELKVLLDAVLTIKYSSPILMDDVATAAALLGNMELFLNFSKLPSFLQISVSVWIEAVTSFGSSALSDVLNDTLSSLRHPPKEDGKCCRLISGLIEAFPQDMLLNRKKKYHTVDNMLYAPAVYRFIPTEQIVAEAPSDIFGDFVELFNNMLERSNDPSDIMKHCEILKKLRLKYSDDGDVQTWANSNVPAQLLKLDTFNDVATGLVLDQAKSLQFEEFKALMNKLIETKGANNRLADIKKHCKLLKRLFSLPSFGKGTVQRDWVDEHITSQFLKLEYYDDDVISMIIEHSEELCSEKAKQLQAEVLIKAASKEERTFYHFEPLGDIARRPKWNTAFEISLKFHEHFRQKPGVLTVWYENEIFRLLRSKESFIEDEVTALMRLIQFGIDCQFSLVYLVFSEFTRQKYSAKYLLHGIFPIASALKLLLKRNSLSLDIPPYQGFASLFRNAIDLVPAPPIPNNYALQAIPSKELNEFFQSNIKHEIIINKPQSDRTRAFNFLRSADSMDTTVTYTMDEVPDTLIVRKLSSNPRKLGALVRPMTVKWKDAFCSKRLTCDCCQKIEECLLWLDLCEIRLDFIETLTPAVNSGGAKIAKSVSPKVTVKSEEFAKNISMHLKNASNSSGNWRKRPLESFLDSLSDSDEEIKKPRRSS